jgi:hypothetical protein
MAVIAELEDGRRLEFPDGTDPSVVQATVKKMIGNAQPQAKQEGVSTLEGIGKGIKDPIDAGAQILTHILPESVVNAGNQANNWLADKTGLVAKLPQGGVDQQIRQQEQEYQKRRGDEGLDWPRMGGNVAALAGTSFIPGLQIQNGKKAFDIANILRSAGQGAIFGGAQPVTEGDFKEEKANQIMSGAGFGAASQPVAAAMGNVISPKVSKEVRLLKDEGVTPSMGQILGGNVQRFEDKLQSLPLIGDAITSTRKNAQEQLNRAAYARALRGTKIDAKTLPVGREGVAAVKSAISQQYDDILPKLSFKPDAQFNQELSQLRTLTQSLPDQEAKQFENILKRELIDRATPQGNLSGETLKTVESQLGKQAKSFGSSSDAYQSQLGDALKQLQSNVRGSLLRQNPQYAKELSQANSNYANYAKIREAGKMAGDMSSGFTPSQLASAVRSQDKSVGKGATATGEALMQDLSDAGLLLNSKYPDSGTAGRLLLSAGLAGGAGAATYNDPSLLPLAALALPYLPGGRQATAKLLTSESAKREALAQLLKQIAPLGAVADSK